MVEGGASEVPGTWEITWAALRPHPRSALGEPGSADIVLTHFWAHSPPARDPRHWTMVSLGPLCSRLFWNSCFTVAFPFPLRDPWRSFTPKPSDLSALRTCRFKSLCQISRKHTAFQKTSTMTSYSVALKKIRSEIPGPMLELKIDLKRHIWSLFLKSKLTALLTIPCGVIFC